VRGKEMNGGYKKLKIYQLSFKLAIEIHKLSLALPKFEMYEEGSQIRRSAKAIPANIAEGYGRRRYKNEFIKYLVYALSSCDETTVHLKLLCETGSISIEQYKIFNEQLNELGIKINYFCSRSKNITS